MYKYMYKYFWLNILCALILATYTIEWWLIYIHIWKKHNGNNYLPPWSYLCVVWYTLKTPRCTPLILWFHQRHNLHRQKGPVSKRYKVVEKSIIKIVILCPLKLNHHIMKVLMVLLFGKFWFQPYQIDPRKLYNHGVIITMLKYSAVPLTQSIFSQILIIDTP